MAPNRKEIASVLRSFSTEDLAGFVHESKYAPLTGAAAAQAPSEPDIVQQQQHAETEEAKPQTEAIENGATESANYWDEAEAPQFEEEEGDSYWGWPPLSPRLNAEVEALEAEDAAEEEEAAWADEVTRRQTVISQIMAEEQARSAVSLGNIEAHLKKDAERRKEEGNDTVEIARNEDKVQEEEEGYWDWNDENDVPPDQETFSASRIEELLKKESVRIQIHSHSPQEVAISGGKLSDKYWEWTILTSDEAKQRLIKSILEEERIRRMLAADNIESQLKSDSARSSAEFVRSSQESSPEDYWSWNAPEVIRAPHTQDPSHPSNGYWDWKPALSKDEARRVIIDAILKDEEARRTLSASHMEETLKESQWRWTRNEAEGYASCPAEEKEEVAYWDM